MTKKEKKLALSRKAQEMINNDVLVCDIEATGLDFPDVISIAVISSKTGEILIDELVKPVLENTLEAQRIHNIDIEMVADKEPFIEIWKRFETLRSGRRLTSFMTEFDYRAIEYSLSLYEDDKLSSLRDVTYEALPGEFCLVGTSADDKRLPRWECSLDEAIKTECIMDMATRMFGSTNHFKTTSLQAVMNRLNLQFEGKPHTALADAAAALAILRHIATFEERYRAQLLQE